MDGSSCGSRNRPRAIRWLAFVLLGLGCASTSTGTYTLDIVFSTLVEGSVRDAIKRIDVYVVDDCSGLIADTPPSDFKAQLSVQRGQSAVLSGKVPAGTHGFYALARDGDCAVVASVCEVKTLQTGAASVLPVILTLEPAFGAACASGEICSSDYECVPDSEVDAGMDARVEDCGEEADGTLCTAASNDGQCRGGVCCTGCWDGEMCRSGTGIDACGAGGADCNACTCASDLCESGACQPPVVIEQMSIGFSHSCGVSTLGRVYCWGQNDAGQLGNGDQTLATRLTPHLIANLAAQAEVYTGWKVSCARSDAGDVHCWGFEADGTLGVNVVGNQVDPQLVGSGFTQLSLSDSTVCAVRNAGELWCWGEREYAEAAQAASLDPVALPTQVGAGTNWVAAGMGHDHGCAIRNIDDLYCWGRNEDGELGVGNEVLFTSPVDVGRSATRFACGRAVTCFLEADGSMFCMGRNDKGQYGSGDTTTADVPVAAASGMRFERLALGNQHICGLRADGSLFCWGSDTSGQVGNGDGGASQFETPQQIGNVGEWANVFSGASALSTCATKVDGTLWCWGKNIEGQLGLGDNESRTAPERVCF